LGWIAANRGDTDRALVEYNEALRCDPDDVSALTNSGVLLLERNRTDEALARLRHAVDRDANPLTLLAYARALRRAGRDVAAIDTYQRLLSSVPSPRGLGRPTLELAKLLLSSEDPRARDPRRALRLLDPLCPSLKKLQPACLELRDRARAATSVSP
jgi:tetratricopeptide (TPR) repeat protein